MIRPFREHAPQLHPSCFVAESAAVIGDVTLSEDASVWYGAVVRGDTGPIRIGPGSNVQDCAVLHTDRGFDLTLGCGVTVGHAAVVHGAQVGDHVVIGMHATLLNGCRIGANSIIGAGALVREGQIIPENSLVVGCPARVLRQVTPQQLEGNRWNARHYIDLAKEHLALLSNESDTI